MQASTRKRPDARLILTLVAALIVASYDRRWLARPVKDLVPEDIRLDWLSHIKARVIATFLSTVVLAMRPGRPPVERTKASTLVLEEDLAHVRELHATKLETEKKRKTCEWLVEVYTRLLRDHGLGVEAFCKALDISERTFRSWRARAVRAQAPALVPEPKPRRRPRGEGRFDLDRTLPGIQQMADTTDWDVLGVALKVASSQDPGNRERELWSDFRVGLVDTGQVVLDLEKNVLQPGSQLIHDRGTPYMSAQVEQGLDALGAERAPCKEYTPTEKATCERSFRTVKEVLAPVVGYLSEITDRMPELHCPKIAVTLGGLLLELFHRSYNLGHRRIRHPLAGEDEEVLRCIAQEQREKALSDFRSKLSTLGRIHDQYAMSLPRTVFIRGHRAHALEDIVEAEQRMRRAACAEGIAVPHQYFAAILNSVAGPGRERRRLERIELENNARQDCEYRLQQANRELWDRDPVAYLHHALGLLASQWRNDYFLFDGSPSRGSIASAIEGMAKRDPLGFEDDAHLECRRWHAGRDPSGPSLDAILKIVDGIIVNEHAATRPPKGAAKSATG